MDEQRVTMSEDAADALWSLVHLFALVLGGYLLGRGLGNPAVGAGVALLVWFHKG